MLSRKQKQAFITALAAGISTSRSFSDLMPFLQIVTFDELKAFVLQKVAGFDVDGARSAHFRCSQMQHILPDDVLQHILSFQGLQRESTKHVSKRWLRLSEQNELNCYRKAQALVRQNEFVPFDPAINRMLIVDPKRRRLTRIERALPVLGHYTYNLNEALSLYNSGDALLVHGRHILDPIQIK